MKYYVNRNAQENGDHEVHQQMCPTDFKVENGIGLGDFPSCRPAVEKAKKMYPTADGCKICSPDCHTR